MIEDRIKLRHLACFVEVATQRSFSKAAMILSLTQPAVSKALAELEEILGVPLLERSRRGVALTVHGEVFSRYAATILVSLREGVSSVAAEAMQGGAALVIGALPTAAAELVPEAVQRAKQQGLSANLRVVTGPNEYLLTLLRAGSLDIVVGRLGEMAVMQGLSFEPLYSEDLVFIARPGHPLTAGRPVAMREIAGYPVLLPPLGSVIRPDIERLMLSHGVPPLPDVIETVSPSFGRRYIRTSDAVWIISQGVVIDDLEAGFLAALPVAVGPTTGAVGITMRPDARPTLAVNLLKSAFRTVGGEIDRRRHPIG